MGLPGSVEGKIFPYLSLKQRIITHDQMARRGINCDLPYVMCNTCACETTRHLLFECSYVKSVWNCMATRYRNQLMVLGDSVEHTWEKPLQSGQRGRYTYSEGVDSMVQCHGLVRVEAKKCEDI